MTDREALMAAVRAAPADDLPRLVYADWLEEHGDADRAEFIRLSCEPPAPERQSAVEARTRELLAANLKCWRIPGLRGRQRFERGFVGEVETSAAWLLPAPVDGFREHPIRAMRLVVIDHHVARIAALPIWDTVESLTLNNNSFGSGGRLETFFGDARFPRLRDLSLRNNQLWPESVEVLAGLPMTPQLTRLDLSGNPISDRGCEVLGARPEFASLRELLLRSDELNEEDCIHDDGLYSLAGSDNFLQLLTLNLAGHSSGREGFHRAIIADGLPRLTNLDLSYNGIEPSSMRMIEFVPWEHLKRFNLSGSQFDTNDIEMLLLWEHLPLLERLDLRDCGDVGALAGLPNVLSGPRLPPESPATAVAGRW